MSDHSSLRLIIAAGGTGGHVLPAVAVLRELRAREIALVLLWIGGGEGIEADTARAEGVRFAAIPTGKFRRYFDLRTIPDAINIPRGVLAARKRVKVFKPDVVFSTGGFVSVPTVLASRGRAPVITHEQTTIVGLANKINARTASVVAVSFDGMAEAWQRADRKVVLTGNPVRAELAGGNSDRGLSTFGFTNKLPVTYVTGGARGASPLNQRIGEMLPDLLETTQVLHQTGPATANGDHAGLVQLRSTLPAHLATRYVPVEFVGPEIADVYAMADLIVSRAGAGTIAELTALGKVAILIPLPLSGGGEQVTNAGALADKTAAVMIKQGDATPTRLLTEITSLLADQELRLRMASTAASLGRPDAAARLADEILELAGWNSTPRPARD
jgi:UDP-N-acetylglucosamine--N-acetylmuramyl-(pentapeptide) pyrophosphoryl-undecaprenol N-acetylglucosamine transferase